MPDHLERRGVLEDADHGQPQACVPVCGSRTCDRDRVERPVLEVEAGEPEVRRRAAKLKLSRRGTTKLSTTARPGSVASASQTSRAEP